MWKWLPPPGISPVANLASSEEAAPAAFALLRLVASVKVCAVLLGILAVIPLVPLGCPTVLFLWPPLLWLPWLPWLPSAVGAARRSLAAATAEAAVRRPAR